MTTLSSGTSSPTRSRQKSRTASRRRSTPSLGGEFVSPAVGKGEFLRGEVARGEFGDLLPGQLRGADLARDLEDLRADEALGHAGESPPGIGAVQVEVQLLHSVSRSPERRADISRIFGYARPACDSRRWSGSCGPVRAGPKCCSSSAPRAAAAASIR